MAGTGLLLAASATRDNGPACRPAEERGRYRLVQPDIVLEVAFDTIQPSERHASGYALRFPRILRIRDDKPVREIDTLAYCRELADQAAHGWKTSPPGPPHA